MYFTSNYAKDKNLYLTLISNPDKEKVKLINENNKIIFLNPDYILNVRERIARKKGCIMSGNNINEQKVSDMIINDFRNGKFGKITIESPEEN